jgi:zinc protease
MESRFTSIDRGPGRNAGQTDDLMTSWLSRSLPAGGTLLLLFLVLAVSFSLATGTGRLVERLRGGPEIILERHPESEVACVAVAVRTGSVFESPDTRGISHLIEHMVFNGSELYSRMDISDWMDDRGAFLNAFTRKETAVYFLVVPHPNLEQGIEILSQMLLHSAFPPDEFEKERRVILEEIRKSADDPSSVRSDFVERYLYRGSLLTEPVLGYPAAIEALSREDVVGFYRGHYRCAAMRIFITGNFDARRAKGWIADYFASGGDGMTDPAAIPDDIDVTPRWSGEVTIRSGDGMEPGFDIIVPLPVPGDRDFPAALLLSSILQGKNSPLTGIFDSLSLPEPDAFLEVHSRFSALRIHASGGGSAESYGKVPDALTALAGWEPSAADLEAARTAFLSSELFDREKYHFYIMLHGERMALFGDSYLTAAFEGVKGVGVKDCRRLLRTYFGRPRFNACLIDPASGGSLVPGERGMRDVTVLENGCRLISAERTNSEVAALHILIAGRTCMERDSMNGMAALMHAVLEASAGDLSRELETLGARVQWQDNPYIPFDDYFLNPSFSFLRLEAPAENIERAAGLLLDLVSAAELSEDDLARAKGTMERELRIRGSSATAALRAAVFRELLSDHPYGSSIFPEPEALAAVDLGDVSEFRERYFRGGNLIASLVSPLSAAESEDLLQRLFSSVPEGEFGRCPPLPEPSAHRDVTDTTQKEGAYIAAGWLIPVEKAEETAALLVAAEILGKRMQQELREKQGLTYSTGCGVTLVPGGAVAVASIGTRAQNLEIAEEGLKREIERFGGEPPAPAEVRTAMSRLLGRWSRSELSSINEAYAACRDIFITGGNSPMRSLVERITADDVAGAAGRAFSVDRAVLVRLVPGGSGGGETMPPAMRMRMK